MFKQLRINRLLAKCHAMGLTNAVKRECHSKIELSGDFDKLDDITLEQFISLGYKATDGLYSHPLFWLEFWIEDGVLHWEE